jgi:hypothetical protein
MTFVIIIIIISSSSSSIQPLGRFWQKPEPSPATGMALVRCVLGKFLGVGCHCFPLECGVFGRKRKNRTRMEMWAKKWLLGRDKFTDLNVLNFIRNDSPEDYKNYLRLSDENVQYLNVQ